MPNQYAYQYSEAGMESRKRLTPEAQAALSNVLDELTANPDAYPNRTQTLGSGGIRVYSHPAPAMEVTYEVDAVRKILVLWHIVVLQIQRTKPVFISYSHKDAPWLDKLKVFLKPLEDQQLIRVWDDSKIRPGADWMKEIRVELEAARVAVFLVTPDFLASDFIRTRELPKLLEEAEDGGCQIFWIAVSSANYSGCPITKYEAVNPPDKPLDLLTRPQLNKALTEISKKMEAAVTSN